jgi:TonB family protein
MLAHNGGRLLLLAGLLLACDRDVASAPPDDGLTPTHNPSQSTWDDPAPVADAEAEPLDTSFRVEGGLSREQVQSVIDQQFTSIRECFDRALDRVDQIDIGGAIVLRWAVGTSGDVLDAEIEGSSFGDRETERCILEAVQRWSFPAPKKKPATIHYAFHLRSY